jgi:hypothetical protein
MATRTDYEWFGNNMREDGTSYISRFSLIHSFTAAQIARSIWYTIAQIMVSSLF